MKILLLYYYEGAGGKYLANLLAHSHHVAFADSKIAHDILQDPAQVGPACLSTIPSKEKSREWGKYENGCDTLFGKNIMRVKYVDLPNIYPAYGPWFNNEALNHQWLPLIAHRPDALFRQKKFFSQHQIYTVYVNTAPEFIDCAIRLKWPEEHHCLNLDDYRQFVEDNKLLKFDYELQWDPRDRDQYTKVVDLACSLGFEFSIESAKEYMDCYINFHL